MGGGCSGPDRRLPVAGALVSGQWQFVNEWLRAKGHRHDDWDVPTEGEVARINEWLATSPDPRRRADHRPTIVRQGEPLMATTQPYRYDSVSV